MLWLHHRASSRLLRSRSTRRKREEEKEEEENNNATREQIEGRINRIGQKAKELHIRTVHCGILTFILQHHKDARSLSQVLQTLADEVALPQ